jgi:hypothetical protein
MPTKPDSITQSQERVTSFTHYAECMPGTDPFFIQDVFMIRLLILLRIFSGHLNQNYLQLRTDKIKVCEGSIL